MPRMNVIVNCALVSQKVYGDDTLCLLFMRPIHFRLISVKVQGATYTSFVLCMWVVVFLGPSLLTA